MPMLRRLAIFTALVLCAGIGRAQSGIEMSGPLPVSQPIPGRLIVVYRRPILPAALTQSRARPAHKSSTTSRISA